MLQALDQRHHSGAGDLSLQPMETTPEHVLFPEGLQHPGKTHTGAGKSVGRKEWQRKAVLD